MEDRTGFAVITKNKLISAYTPSNTDPQLLKRVFVQREQLLDTNLKHRHLLLITENLDHGQGFLQSADRDGQ